MKIYYYKEFQLFLKAPENLVFGLFLRFHEIHNQGFSKNWILTINLYKKQHLPKSNFYKFSELTKYSSARCLITGYHKDKPSLNVLFFQ
jgi:hypothetical protein